MPPAQHDPQWVHCALPDARLELRFAFDRTDDRPTLKCLTVADEFMRQGLDVRVGRSVTASDVICTLDELFRQHGRPACLRSDNGPELVGKAVQSWLKDKHLETH